MTDIEINDADLPEPSLKNIIDQHSLQWVFVGGKGGVGKTTTSCCLGVQLALTRKKVLIVSTDPAHNLSDAFCQKIGREPTPIEGFDNLCAMEIDANNDMEEMQRNMAEQGTDEDQDGGLSAMMSELTNSIPGIDEAMSFSELMKQVQNLDFDVVVFDTAPTGHTLRLLSFPTILEKALGKVMELKDRFGGLIGQATAMMGGGQNPGAAQDAILGRLEETRAVINKVNDAFQDPSVTTFVCVCIPEFLSIYETERLVQELSKFGIDTHNIVVNQVLFPEKDAEELAEWYSGNKDSLPAEAQEICSKMLARKRMQDKYIGQCFDLYGEDFHVTLMPLLDFEVRGSEKLKEFSEFLTNPVDLDE
ncbi:anion-transporting ATPase-like domain containing protein [Nitzschia inconspicua]|uniref:ATPase ASNA1 homolog n=1 Tax=Nitzschia inconspicua TaxID=303405 RepID=A0A9K3L1S4_9STRA|nr:anion-transporting ATPase-like domain containing protein [Nitzschia inconspicua]KAG7367273.1 anion-transporting ATPase-like domain containing protein [Nitzschia inconspicua]